MTKQRVGEEVHWAQSRILAYVAPIYHLRNALGDMKNLRRSHIFAFMFEHEEVGSYDVAHRLPHLLQRHAQRKAALLTVAAYHFVCSRYVFEVVAVELYEVERHVLRMMKVLPGAAVNNLS